MKKPAIISVVNEKGGVGKTTTTISVARELKSRGFETLVVDLDQQGNAGLTLGFIPDRKPASAELIYNSVAGFDVSLEDIVRREDIGLGSMDYIPASEMLTTITSIMATDNDSNYILKRIFDNEFFERYDFIIFDCRTLLDLLVLNALNASDYVIIPDGCAVYSHNGLSRVLDKVEGIQRSTNPNLKMLGILINQKPNTTIGNSVVSAARDEHGSKIFNTVISFLPSQAETSIVNPTKVSAYKGLKDAFASVVDEIFERMLED